MAALCAAWATVLPVTAQTITNPPPKWESTAAAGLTLTRGNSETLLATIVFGTIKKWDRNEMSLGADGTYGESTINGVSSQTANSIHGFGQYNRLFDDRWYGYFRADALHDEIADVDYRVTLAPGLGYYFIKEKKTDLCAEIGPGYVIERLGGIDDNYASLRLGEKFHHQLSDRARVWETVEWIPQVDNFGNYLINAVIGIEADLRADKKMTLQAFLQDNYNSKPATDRESNDAKLVVAVAYKF